MNTIKTNILANFCGSVWTALMGLVFVPLYIHFLGIEAYGLMGIFGTVLALFGLLDMGLSITLNREMARLAVQEGKSQEMRDLVRTLEIPYWLIGLFISIIVIVLSPFIAYHWVNAEKLSPKTVRTAITLMGLAVAFQWPISFYSGGLMGLQRQVLLNIINIVMATFRGLGAVLILWLVSSTVEAFFLWQIVVSIVNIGLIVFSLWRSLPHAAEAPRFRRELLLNIWRFAAGMTGATVLVTILMQMDKVILSRMLSLTMFGYYALASTVAMTLGRFVSPVFSATYPRLTNLVALGATEEIVRLYHKSAQLMSVLVLPAALVVALFSREILMLWTRSPATAEHTHLLVSILVMGSAINGILNIPYALQLASGWTRLVVLANVVSVLLLAPLMIVLTKWYGAAGAASVWVILNVGYMFISLPIMHRRLLPTEQWRWYFEDVGRPLVAAVVVAVIGRCIIKSDWSPWLLLASLGTVSAGTLVASACAANQLDAVARVKSFWLRFKWDRGFVLTA
ncbi:MAG: oligosaccharide flippase family protein [Elusimicrobia bacterium]|nr:oligosaccharide flippase family protein [Elusimicrobiota bacterium]